MASAKMKCNEDNLCVVCPYRYCIDEEEMYQRLIRDTKEQVERWGLHWIRIWFEAEDTVALKAFERYKVWLRAYGFDGKSLSYKEWICYTVDSHKPVTNCGCHDGTFYFKPIHTVPAELKAEISQMDAECGDTDE